MAPLSNSALSPQNMEISPCRVSFNGVDLGGTMKTVKIAVETKKAALKVDQLGESDVDFVWSGLNIKVETVLAEIKDKAKWKAALASMKKVGSGNGAMYMQSAMGQKDSAIAAALLLHPLSQADTVKDFDHTFYLAVPDEVTEVVFGPTEQQGLKVVWRILPDTSTTPARWWFHGDPANGLVAATAGVPAFTGTGNGTMTSVSVFSGFTKTETITAKCVGVSAANKSNWVVSGSVSGALGELEITAGTPGNAGTFTSSVIAFTITDGTTDFAVGDAFTVATTAANYA